jgi:hypothetical protein
VTKTTNLEEIARRLEAEIWRILHERHTSDMDYDPDLKTPILAALNEVKGNG